MAYAGDLFLGGYFLKYANLVKTGHRVLPKSIFLVQHSWESIKWQHLVSFPFYKEPRKMSQFPVKKIEESNFGFCFPRKFPRGSHKMDFRDKTAQKEILS